MTGQPLPKSYGTDGRSPLLSANIDRIMIIATERLRPPEDYKVTLRVLGEARALTEDSTRRMRDLAGLRNLLVHVYADVDDALLYATRAPKWS